MNLINLIRHARDAKSEDGENPEYDRALVETVCSALGLSSLYADDPKAMTELVLGGTP